LGNFARGIEKIFRKDFRKISAESNIQAMKKGRFEGKGIDTYENGDIIGEYEHKFKEI